MRDRDRLKLFVNGELKAESPSFKSTEYDITNTLPLLIGAGPLNYLSGTLSDIRLLGGSLTSEQVLDLFQRSSQ
jgi:hypothetical protein